MESLLSLRSIKQSGNDQRSVSIGVTKQYIHWQNIMTEIYIDTYAIYRYIRNRFLTSHMEASPKYIFK